MANCGRRWILCKLRYWLVPNTVVCINKKVHCPDFRIILAVEYASFVIYNSINNCFESNHGLSRIECSVITLHLPVGKCQILTLSIPQAMEKSHVTLLVLSRNSLRASFIGELITNVMLTEMTEKGRFRPVKIDDCQVGYHSCIHE